jgi:type IV pilus assembly protein PilB
MTAGVRQFVDILLEDGLVTEQQLVAAFDIHELEGRPLGQVLVDQGLITESQLVAVLAEQIGLNFVDLTEAAVDATAVAKIPVSVCRRHNVLPIGYEGGKLLVAMADPGNVIALDDIRQMTRMDVQPIVATREDLAGAINRYCRSDDELDELQSSLSDAASDSGDDLASMTEVVEDAPIVKYVNLLITQAISDRASDIHIEPTEHDLRIRYRIDGVLHEVMKSPKSISGGVTSRLKIMADIDIAERRIPQDGRLSVQHQGREDRHAYSRQLHGQYGFERLGVLRRELRPFQDLLRQAVRDDPGHRADRVG